MTRSLLPIVGACLLISFFNPGCKKEIKAPTAPIVNSVNNNHPVAKAGNDTTIFLPSNQASLDGSKSYDLDNDIRSYKWLKISGPASCTIVNPDSAKTSVTNLIKGSYQFGLMVTDSKGASGLSYCFVHVDSIVNGPPPPGFWISMNPHDTNLYLPANEGSFTASTWSMINQPIQPAIDNIEWRKAAGPNHFNIQSPGALSTQITNLAEGLYAFQCKITDTSGFSAISYTTINVTDTSTPGTEVIVPDQSWDGHLGGAFIRVNLSQYLPGGKSVKKVFIKEDCDAVFTRAHYLTQAPPNTSYLYVFEFLNNEFFMYVYYGSAHHNCIGDPNNKPDVKIVY
jgi:hypothetical protein